ncbi:MAG: GNAT family N-acetyltransferase [Nitrospiraceae bacterium]
MVFVAKTIEHRWLDGDELDQIQLILQNRGWTPLNKPTSRALAAFDGDKLVGFIVLQLVPHTEPLWIDPDYRGSYIAEGLAQGMRQFMRSIEARCFMVMADNPHAVRLCEESGMQLVKSPVYISVRK